MPQTVGSSVVMPQECAASACCMRLVVACVPIISPQLADFISYKQQKQHRAPPHKMATITKNEIKKLHVATCERSADAAATEDDAHVAASW